MFGGQSGSGDVAEGQQANDNAVASQGGYDNGNVWAQEQQLDSSCEMSAKGLSNCLGQNGGDMQICGWYLEQLKSCQAAARNY